MVIGRTARRVSRGATRSTTCSGTRAATTSRPATCSSATRSGRAGKALDTFAPMGPWIVTADEIPDPQALGIRCLVNGETRQDDTTARHGLLGRADHRVHHRGDHARARRRDLHRHTARRRPRPHAAARTCSPATPCGSRSTASAAIENRIVRAVNATTSRPASRRRGSIGPFLAGPPRARPDAPRRWSRRPRACSRDRSGSSRRRRSAPRPSSASPTRSPRVRSTTDALARRVGADADALGRLLRLLSVARLLHAADADGRWRNNATSELLRADHPDSMRDWVRFLGSDWLGHDLERAPARRSAPAARAPRRRSGSSTST